MGLDIRLPIGYMFSLVGVILVITGLTHSDADSVRRSLGINVNLYWGLFLVAFGLVMLLSARRAAKKSRE